MEITRDWIKNYIETQPEEKVSNMIGRALVVLLDRQTEDEKVSNDTKYTNQKGFTAFDAKAGSVGAKTFLKYGRLRRWQWEKWAKPVGKKGYPRIAKYAKQLNESAQAKAARVTQPQTQEPTPKVEVVREHCGRCAGTGQFITYVENNQPKGPGGICFRCEGKGYQTPEDKKRNEYYDTHRTVYV